MRSLDKIQEVLDLIIYWSIVVMPFSVAIAPGPANVFIGLMVLAFLSNKIIFRKKLFVKTPVTLPFLVLILVSFLSFGNSIDMSDSFRGIIKLLKYLFIFLICAEEVKDVKHIKRIVLSLASGVFLVSIDAFWQLFSGKDFIWGAPAWPSTINLARASASFPDPNVMGIYLCAIIPLVAGLALFYRKGKTSPAMIVVGILAVSGLLVTFSRGSGLGLYIALLFLSIVNNKKILTALLLCVLLVYPLIMPPQIKQWAKEINYNPLVFMFNRDRISIYKNAINMIEHHPVIGVGVNTFSRNYLKYKLPEPENAKSADAVYAHNIYLHMAGEIGLLGLGAFLWFIYVFFRQGFAVYKKLDDGYLKVVAVSLLACVLAFLVNGFTETNLYYPRVVMVFWYLIGVSLALNKFTVLRGAKP